MGTLLTTTRRTRPVCFCHHDGATEGGLKKKISTAEMRAHRRPGRAGFEGTIPRLHRRNDVKFKVSRSMDLFTPCGITSRAGLMRHLKRSYGHERLRFDGSDTFDRGWRSELVAVWRAQGPPLLIRLQRHSTTTSPSDPAKARTSPVIWRPPTERPYVCVRVFALRRSCGSCKGRACPC